MNCLEVRDASTDFRFKDNPAVTGPPNVRFYAGTPLISPEGYRLGTVCIVSNAPRPQGLTENEVAALKDLASMASTALVDRRAKMEKKENPAHVIAYAAHDLMTPLTRVQLSLSLLMEDEEVQRKLDRHQLELLTTANNCSGLMIRICKTMDSLRRGPAETKNEKNKFFAQDSGDRHTNMTELVDSLNKILEPIPKQVPLILRLDPKVPCKIVGDDLKLFRSAINLLSSAADRTKSGCIQFRIFAKDEDSQLVFECDDTGDDIPVDEYQHLFRPSRAEDGNLRLCMSSVANLISSLDGEFGFYPVGDITKRGGANAEQRTRTGSVFWFSIPLVVPGSSSGDATDKKRRPPQPCAYKLPIIPATPRTASNTSLNAVPLHRGTRPQTSVVSTHGNQLIPIPHNNFSRNMFRTAAFVQPLHIPILLRFPRILIW
jgi:signal transduction histidine kinase